MNRLIHILTTVSLATAMLLAAGCAKVEWNAQGTDGEETVVSFSLRLDNGLETKAIADGGMIDQVVVAIYEKGKEVKIKGERIVKEWPLKEGETIDLTLLQNHTYQILFWAQHEDTYSINEEGIVSLDYSSYLNGGLEEMEKLDVFCTVETFKPVKGTVPNNTVIMSRPIAQLNFADPLVKPVDGVHTASIELKGIATSYDILNSEATVTAETATFTFNKFPTESLNDSNYIAGIYLFPVSGLTASYSMTGVTTKEIKDITLEANKRTNVIGSLVQVLQTVDTWDKETFTAPDVETDSEGRNRYVVNEASDFAWLASDENNLEEPGTFVITTDIDMDNAGELKPVRLPAGSAVIGDGDKARTIRNLNLGGAVFADAMELTVTNLTIENAAISCSGTDVTHVGVLVNTLKGSSTFTNVSIKNSSVTTDNGAAGGVVGSITKDENSTDALNVTFDNCHVEGTTVSGSLSEGHFVGLFRGYDNSESLTFNDNCSFMVSETAAISETPSPYTEGNEAEWLSENDYSKFSGYLGDEEYYRGIITYGVNRFIPKWDGSTSKEPLLIDSKANNYYIYSAFDLAYLQGKTPNQVIFKENVDLGGVRRENEWVGESKDKGTNPFTPIESIKYLDGENHTLYNLYVEVDYMGGFISYAAGESTHENLTFENSSVIVHFVTLSEGNKKEDRGYAGTLTPVVWSGTNYIVSNIKVNNGFVFGLGKIGGLIGFIDSGTTGSSIEDCTVIGTMVKNEKGKTEESFIIVKFYAHGEAGGFIGMLMGNSNISNCQVNNTTLDCYGENDEIGIPGRHVNQFIGDIRTPNSQVISIDGCSANNNTYVSGMHKNQSFTYSYKEGANSWGWGGTTIKNTTNYAGCVYSIIGDTKGTVKIDGKYFMKP